LLEEKGSSFETGVLSVGQPSQGKKKESHKPLAAWTEKNARKED